MKALFIGIIKRKYDYSNIDIFSRMYPSLEEIQEYMEQKPISPFF